MSIAEAPTAPASPGQRASVERLIGPEVSVEVGALIKQIATANPYWGGLSCGVSGLPSSFSALPVVVAKPDFLGPDRLAL